jgi:hypothetical protein
MKRLTRLGIIALAVFLAGPAGAQPTTVQAPPGGLDVNVVNDQSNPVPVTVQETAIKEPLRAHKRILDIDNVTAFFWADTSDTLFSEVPPGHILVITDIIISIDGFGDFNDPFLAVFWKLTDGSETRYLDIAGKFGPFSHPFATPLILKEGYSLGASSDANKLQIILTGYLQSVAE